MYGENKQQRDKRRKNKIKVGRLIRFLRKEYKLLEKNALKAQTEQGKIQFKEAADYMKTSVCLIVGAHYHEGTFIR